MKPQKYRYFFPGISQQPSCCPVDAGFLPGILKGGNPEGVGTSRRRKTPQQGSPSSPRCHCHLLRNSFLFKSLRLRPPTPEAYGKTADFGTLCIPGSSQRRDPSAALLSSSDRSRLAALNVMLTPCPVP